MPIPRLHESAVSALRFAFYGRVSTEDNQDPEASRNWQRTRALGLIEPLGGQIVEDFFDIGMSRSLPWKRRPRAAELLAALANPQRGFDAVVIGEPQRAFYDNQYSLTMPVFSHYDVGLWVPEVGGAIDPNSEAHDLIMSVFGGMSKGERNRVKVRVRSAMASQAKIEGRFLGGRPPYGYQLADAGPHPNPGKAADGRRLHRLVPDPAAAPIVKRIFRDYLSGLGLKAIAERLTCDGIVCPSAHDRARNSHRSGTAWGASAVRVILTNPRYTGRQVWNKQRKQETLLDIEDVAAGYETKLKWNGREKWIWSDTVAHEPLVSVEDLEAVQALLAQRGTVRARLPRDERPVTRTYVLRGRIWCGLCGRKMQGNANNGRAHYRCRYLNEYAKANHIEHPPTIYLREDAIVPRLDAWLAKAFAPHRLAETVGALAAASAGDDETEIAAAGLRKQLADCERKLAQYRALLDEGADAATVAGWMREVEAERIAVQAKLRSSSGRQAMSPEEITAIVTALGDLVKVLADADSADKMKIYQQLGLRLTYDINANALDVELETANGPGLRTRPECHVPNVSVRGGT